MRKFLVKNQYKIVCIIFTFTLLLLGFFRFPSCLGRLVESCRDFGTSIIYAFCYLFDIDSEIAVTVNQYPDFEFLNLKSWVYSLLRIAEKPNITNPSTFIPSEWELFKTNWVLYWQAFANKKVFFKYIK